MTENSYLMVMNRVPDTTIELCNAQKNANTVARPLACILRKEGQTLMVIQHVRKKYGIIVRWSFCCTGLDSPEERPTCDTPGTASAEMKKEFKKASRLVAEYT